jgi:hypothetical protein
MSFTYGVEMGDCEDCGRYGWIDFHTEWQSWLCPYCWKEADDYDALLDDAFDDISFEDLDENVIGDVLR